MGSGHCLRQVVAQGDESGSSLEAPNPAWTRVCLNPWPDRKMQARLRLDPRWSRRHNIGHEILTALIVFGLGLSSSVFAGGRVVAAAGAEGAKERLRNRRGMANGWALPCRGLR